MGISNFGSKNLTSSFIAVSAHAQQKIG